MVMKEKKGSNTKKRWLPIARDKIHGWNNYAAIIYSAMSVMAGFIWMIENRGERFSVPKLVLSILSAAHGRIIATYLVHECAHSSIFVDPWANECLGITCLWLAGCPYADFDHVKVRHWHHHKDRADPFEWDFHAFLDKYPLLRRSVLLLEWAFIPAVETIMHLRTALYPIIFPDHQCTPRRCQSARIGSTFQIILYLYLFQRGALFSHLLAGAFVLHFLALHDAFQHTYETYPISQHKPGPNGRTAQYEEENTYSNLLSDRVPWLNLLSLNFGYHNAHHKKPMVPWYALPDLHDTVYPPPLPNGDDDNDNDDDDNDGGSGGAMLGLVGGEQLLPMRDLFYPWFVHRCRRVTDDDYGVVHPPGTTGRAHNFIGALGVSFLTV